MSLDPTQPNFVSRVIGDNTFNYNATENYLEVSGSYPNRSRFIRVKEVNLLTPNYLNNAGNAKDIYTGSIPVVGTGSANGSFTGGTGSNISAYTAGGNYYFKAGTASGAVAAVTQGLIGTDYDNMLDLLANQDDYAFNVLLTPGLFNSAHASQTTTAINNTQNRGDSIYVLDPIVYGSTIAATNTQAASRNTSYAAMYWPWLQTIDPDSGQNVWVPASTMLGGVYAYNDSVSEPWFAPAGINRGGLGNVIRPERKLTQSNRDSLYTNNVNPIASFPGVGTVVYGQKTLQRQASALDRVNVRRLLIALKGYISQVSQTLLFEQNTAATRNNFLAAVNPYLESVQQRQGLYAFKVVMDDSNNTPDVIDRNQLVGAIYLQPTKTAEFIILDFNVLPTGATFPS
jgi:phage tail sheath protein FI